MRRRHLLAATALTPLAAALPARAQPGVLTRPIPASGARIPAIGMGTWLTFDVGDSANERRQRAEVLARFFEAGGGMIDSSPMYGRAEAVVGALLPQVKHAGRLFSATKVWTAFERIGPSQIETSLKLWGQSHFDLLQVHNLLNWRAHLKTLRAAREAGRCRYIGVTTSHGRRHDEMAQILKTEKIDFMQITYSLADRSAEPLLDLAAERGVAVIVNRPFDGGQLFDVADARRLPGWAGEVGCATWAEFFLKWIVAHPAVTCAIPATTKPQHMIQNMAAARGPMPDAAGRRRMAQYWDQG